MVDEPVIQTAPVANEPITQAAPVADEPVRQAAPIVEEPTKQTAPIVDEPVKQTVPVVSEPVKQTTTLDTPPVSEKPTLPAEIKKPSSTAAKKPFTYTSPNIKFEDSKSIVYLAEKRKFASSFILMLGFDMCYVQGEMSRHHILNRD